MEALHKKHRPHIKAGKYAEEEVELTGHSTVASDLLNLKTSTSVSPATPSIRLSAHRNRCCMAKGSSSGSGFLHFVLSNSLPVFSLYNTCRVTAMEVERQYKLQLDSKK